MRLLLENVRCVDPACGVDEVANIAIKDGKIVEVGKKTTLDRCKRRDLKGKIALPGLVDMHVHLREPGQEYKEDIASGSRAAAWGGFTAVCAMPNTVPVCDTGSRVAYVVERAEQPDVKTRVHAVGALTMGLKGESLAEIGDMFCRGAVAFSDDGRGVQDGGLMRIAMDYVKQFGAPVLSHCELEDLAGAGVVNEGVVSTRLGMAGWPAVAEEVQIARDIALSELTGCALHIQHVSTARGVELVRRAKAAGLAVSCEVTPHHLFLSEDDVDLSYNTAFKMNPPLRTRADNEALQAALIEGVIDCIATDHAPHAAHEKALEFELAPFGTTGLETALALVLTHLVHPGRLSYAGLVERMAHAPRRILNLEPVGLYAGSTADITIIDPELAWTAGSGGTWTASSEDASTASSNVTSSAGSEDWQSKSTNSAFSGVELIGRAYEVYVGGLASLQEGALT